MKTCLFLLIFIVSSLASTPVLAAAASYTTGVAQSDSLPPINHTVVKKQKPEATAVLSVVLGVLGFGSLNLGFLAILAPFGFLLGSIALVRIWISKGKRKGLGLAVLGTSLSALGLAIIVALIVAFGKGG